MGRRVVGLGGIKNDQNVGQEDGGVIYRNGEVTERRRFGGWGSGLKGDHLEPGEVSGWLDLQVATVNSRGLPDNQP